MKFKVCPRCGSEDIEWIIPQNWSQWSCNECGYTGPVIEVDKKIQEKIIEHWRKNKKSILEHIKREDEKIEELSDEELEKRLDKLFD